MLSLSPQFRQLMRVATEANTTSFSQEMLSRNLLNQATRALNNATMAFQLLCDAIALQNTTTRLIDTLVQERLPQLEELFRMARDALMTAERDVPLALSRAQIALELAINLTIPNYGVESLQREVGLLSNRTGVISESTALIDSELDAMRTNFSSLNESSSVLLQESRQLTREARELLARAHASLSFGNNSVNMGNRFIETVRELLVELQARLADVDNFTRDLAEVIKNIELAENLSSLAQSEAERVASELREAVMRANTATDLLAGANTILQEAMRVRTVKGGRGVQGGSLGNFGGRGEDVCRGQR